MCNRRLLDCKKGQVGETITWVIATVVIVVVLMFFVFGATALGATKSIGSFKPSLFSVEIGVGDDQFMKKSLFTYVKMEDESVRKLIDRSLSEVDQFNLTYADTKKEIARRYALGNE